MIFESPHRRREIETAGSLRRGETRLDAIGWAWQNGFPQGHILRAREALQDTTVTGQFRSRFSRGLTALAGLSALTLVAGFFAFVSAIERSERSTAARADGIVALTGGPQRIDDAIALLASGHGRRLLISGVNERTSREEIARLNPEQRHWIDCCVDLDYRARNTIGNAIETRRWMRQHHFATVAVVTSNYHMPRTLVEIAHALGEREGIVPHPVVTGSLDIGRWWTDPAAARLLGAEYVKFLAAWLRTRFEADPERSRFAILIGRGEPVQDPVRLLAEPLMRDATTE